VLAWLLLRLRCTAESAAREKIPLAASISVLFVCGRTLCAFHICTRVEVLMFQPRGTPSKRLTISHLYTLAMTTGGIGNTPFEGGFNVAKLLHVLY